MTSLDVDIIPFKDKPASSASVYLVLMVISISFERFEKGSGEFSYLDNVFSVSVMYCGKSLPSFRIRA
jgi:hypothetical protein